MKNRKGFTLVELLAVIAILAVLVIIALPNVMGMFNSAKKSSFATELKNIYKAANQQWMAKAITSPGEVVFSNVEDGACGNVQKLDLTGRDTIKYYIHLNKSGEIDKYYVTDGSYKYSFSSGKLAIEKIQVDDVIELEGETSDNLLVVFSSELSSVCDITDPQPPVNPGVPEQNVTVTYNNNGGSGCTNKTVQVGSQYGELCTPTRNSYTFVGWYSEEGLTNSITSATTVTNTENHTLYAKWSTISITCQKYGCSSGYVESGGKCLNCNASSKDATFEFSGYYEGACNGVVCRGNNYKSCNISCGCTWSGKSLSDPNGQCQGGHIIDYKACNGSTCSKAGCNCDWKCDTDYVMHFYDKKCCPSSSSILNPDDINTCCTEKDKETIVQTFEQNTCPDGWTPA